MTNPKPFQVHVLDKPNGRVQTFMFATVVEADAHARKCSREGVHKFVTVTHDRLGLLGTFAWPDEPEPTSAKTTRRRWAEDERRDLATACTVRGVVLTWNQLNSAQQAELVGRFRRSPESLRRELRRQEKVRNANDA